MMGGTTRALLLWAITLAGVIFALWKIGGSPDNIINRATNTPANNYLDTADEWFNITSLRHRALKKKNKSVPATPLPTTASPTNPPTLAPTTKPVGGKKNKKKKKIAKATTTPAPVVATPVPVVTPLPTNAPTPVPTQAPQKKKNKRNRATPAPVVETPAPTHEISKWQKKQKKKGKELTPWQKKQLAKKNGKAVEEDASATPVPLVWGNKKKRTPFPTPSPPPVVETTTTSTEKPLLVLHIGPQKTATTTLQCELQWFRKLLHEKGNFVFLGRNVHEDCKDDSDHYFGTHYHLDTRKLFVCLNQHSDGHPCNQDAVFQDFESTLAKMANEKLNVIISDDSFAHLSLQNNNLGLLLDAIGKHYRIRMPLVYRHYFAWLVNHYQEHQRPKGRKNPMDRWPKGGKNPEKPAPPFVEWYDQYTSHLWEAEEKNPKAAESTGNYILAASTLDLHPVAYLQQKWSDPSVSEFAPKEDDFVVLDMHDEETSKDIMVDFVHKVLSPELAVALEELKEQQAKEGRSVPTKKDSSPNYDLDLLATKAKKLGYIPNNKKVTRQTVFDYIQKAFPQETDLAAKDVPYKCMDETQLQEFQTRSLALEETVFGDKFTGKKGKSRRNQHKAGFDEYVADHKFCNLDTEELLANESVQNLFGSIGSRIAAQK